MSLEGDDYTIESFSVEITASEVVSLETVCHSIALIPDVLIEVDEDIQLQLVTVNTFINVNIASAVVIIQDVVRKNYRHQSYTYKYKYASLLCFPPFHCSLMRQVKLLPIHSWISQQSCPVEVRRRKILTSLVGH